MTAVLDDLQRAYRILLLHGLVPDGVVIDSETLAAIRREARRDDPRLEWNEEGLDRLFGFRPQLVEGEQARFTTPSRPASASRRADRFTLGELRAL